MNREGGATGSLSPCSACPLANTVNRLHARLNLAGAPLPSQSDMQLLQEALTLAGASIVSAERMPVDCQRSVFGLSLDL